MSFFERFINSKLNAFADWFGRLIVINIMIIFFSLPLITIFPAVSAGYNLLHDYVLHKNPRLVRDYIMYFRENIGKKILLNMIYTLILVLGILNVRYYLIVLEDDPSVFYTFGYYVMLALLTVLYAVIVYSIIVIKVIPKIKLINLFKVSLVVAGKFYFTSVALVVLTISPVLLILTPITSLILVFMGVSIPLTINVIITRRAVFYIEGIGEKK